MGTLLVTVAYGARRRDLAVQADVPIADLLGPIADLLGPPATALALAPLGGRALPVDRSLAACGVGHGAVLVLIDTDPGAMPTAARTGRAAAGRVSPRSGR